MSADAADMARREEAADWLDRQDELTPAERVAFEAWLTASPLNAAAFASLQRAMNDPALLEAAEHFRSASTEPSQDRPATTARRPVGRRGPGASAVPRRRGAIIAAAAAAAVAAVMLAVVLAPRRAENEIQDYATATGARTDVVLSDRSVLHLNAETRLHARYSEHARDLRLDQGEALFEVAHDRSRPFQVTAAGARVTAVGTIFDVDLLGDAVEVRVFDGVVKVSSGAKTLPPLRKGEWLILDADGQAKTGAFSPDVGGYWRSDWLEAQGMPLAHVVTRLNRYTGEKIMLGDPALAGRTLTGRFSLKKTPATLAMISAALDLRVVKAGDEIRLYGQHP